MSKNLNSQEIKRENPIGNREANRLTGIEKALHLLSNTMAMIAHSVLSWSVSPSPLNKDQGWGNLKKTWAWLAQQNGMSGMNKHLLTESGRKAVIVGSSHLMLPVARKAGRPVDQQHQTMHLVILQTLYLF